MPLVLLVKLALKTVVIVQASYSRLPSLILLLHVFSFPFFYKLLVKSACLCAAPK